MSYVWIQEFNSIFALSRSHLPNPPHNLSQSISQWDYAQTIIRRTQGVLLDATHVVLDSLHLSSLVWDETANFIGILTNIFLIPFSEH